MTRKRRVTVVVPVYNEGDNIPHFTRAVKEALGALPYDYEILFVDDDLISFDHTDRDSHIRCISGHPAQETFLILTDRI